MSLDEELKNCDLGALMDSLTAYTYSRIKTIGIKNLQGLEPIDFVAEVLTKVAEGKRNWENADCPFKEFLFGCVRSDLNNFFRTYAPLYVPELLDVSDTNNTEIIKEKKEDILQVLTQEGADDDELILFGYWMDGIFKPASIAKDLGCDVKHIYNATKRLEKRLPKIKELITNAN